ncbi:hypothetical protein [Paenibacillus bouchesdurhonensis]|uniref:hypothetical protein n=1 Tax=Paenibacillus bouchesdurhonensis TaxID=1870990 RepID=UPI000DA6199F|nr:hypothetical protein [Paenibacillus bouchesdurhonensis]
MRYLELLGIETITSLGIYGGRRWIRKRKGTPLLNKSSFCASPNFSIVINQFGTLILTGQDALKYFGCIRRMLINLIEAREVDGMIVERDRKTRMLVTNIADHYLEKKITMYLTKQEAQDYLNVIYLRPVSSYQSNLKMLLNN